MDYRSPLSRAINLGSAKTGTVRWWWLRISALALVPLSLWFVFSVATLVGDCATGIQDWIANPIAATLLIAFVVSLFYHAQLGMQEVIEDYVHREGVKYLAILLIKAIAVLLVILSIVSILHVAV